MNDINNIKKFINYLAEAVIIVDKNSCIVFANTACTALLGYTPQELTDSNIEILMEAGSRDKHHDRLHSYIASASEPKRMMERSLLHCVTSEGKVFPVRISISTMKIAEEIYGVALLQDQTPYLKEISLIESQAITDPLTLLYNRRYLEKILLPNNRWLNNHALVGVLFIDLNDFKTINDNHGHDKGDAVLKTVSIRLKETFRNDDLIFRIGGDEFLILVDLGAGSETRKTIKMLGNKLHENLRKPIFYMGSILNTDASIGAGIYPDDFDDIEIMTKLADRAMYLSKKNKAGIFFVSDLPDR